MSAQKLRRVDMQLTPELAESINRAAMELLVMLDDRCHRMPGRQLNVATLVAVSLCRSFGVSIEDFLTGVREVYNLTLTTEPQPLVRPS